MNIKEKSTLELSINSLLANTTISINTKAQLIGQKKDIASRIFDKLVGIHGLGEIKVHEADKPGDYSYVECFIPITDYNITVIITINTDEINVKAKYLESNKKKYEKELLKYHGSLADSIIDRASDSQINELSDFIVLKTIEYIRYLQLEKKINFECASYNIWSNAKINDNN